MGQNLKANGLDAARMPVAGSSAQPHNRQGQESGDLNANRHRITLAVNYAAARPSIVMGGFAVSGGATPGGATPGGATPPDSSPPLVAATAEDWLKGQHVGDADGAVRA